MHQINKEAFGAFVAQLRKEKGLTQKDLAQKLFVSDKAVSKWETGASIPDTALLLPLAELLGVTVTELLMGRRLPPSVPPLDNAQVEDLVKTAIAYPGSQPSRNARPVWALAFCIALLMELQRLDLFHSRKQ